MREHTEKTVSREGDAWSWKKEALCLPRGWKGAALFSPFTPAWLRPAVFGSVCTQVFSVHIWGVFSAEVSPVGHSPATLEARVVHTEHVCQKINHHHSCVLIY